MFGVGAALRLKILHLIPTLTGGGAERQLYYLSNGQAAQGHQVKIAFSRPGPEQGLEFAADLHPLASRHNYDPALLLQLFRLCRSFRPDLLQSWIYQMDVLAALLSIACGIPWILREPSSELAYPPTLKNRLRVLLARRCRAIVSNSAAGDVYWQARLPQVPRFVVRNGLPLEQLAEIPVASQLSWDTGEPLVLSVGRLVSNRSGSKRVESILKAVAEIRRTLPVQVAFCGEGDDLPRLQELAGSLGLLDSVHFLGHQAQSVVWSLMKRADLFITLSAYEGCPNALLEAMACGCPVLVSDIPAHRAILDGESALFVEAENEQETVTQMAACLASPQQARLRANRASETARGLSLSALVSNWQGVYEQVLRRGI